MDTKFLRLLSATIDHACEVVEEYAPQKRNFELAGIPIELEVNTEIPDTALLVLAYAQECFGDIEKVEKALKKQLVEKKPAKVK